MKNDEVQTEKKEVKAKKPVQKDQGTKELAADENSEDDDPLAMRAERVKEHEEQKEIQTKTEKQKKQKTEQKTTEATNKVRGPAVRGQ